MYRTLSCECHICEFHILYSTYIPLQSSRSKLYRYVYFTRYASVRVYSIGIGRSPLVACPLLYTTTSIHPSEGEDGVSSRTRMLVWSAY
jgi:hypothetical protein